MCGLDTKTHKTPLYSEYSSKFLRGGKEHNMIVDGKKLTEEEKRERERLWRERQEYERVHAVELTIVGLRQKSTEMIEDAAKLERLLAEFPDLLKHTSRWRQVRYYSKSVNTKVDKFDLSHDCGCCPDSPLELWPYIETPNGNVYSNPPNFTVGEKHWIHGDYPYAKWKKELVEAGIPESIIQAISDHFKEDAEKRVEIAENSDYADEAEAEGCEESD